MFLRRLSSPVFLLQPGVHGTERNRSRSVCLRRVEPGRKRLQNYNPHVARHRGQRWVWSHVDSPVNNRDIFV